MIDTEKYEGHTEGPWYLIGAQQIVYDKDNNPIAEVEYFAQEHRSYYNKALIADAPLLLAEVKRLRSIADDLYAYIVTDTDIEVVLGVLKYLRNGGKRND